MITRRFGRTGLQMPVLSCGGMRFQESWRDSGQEIDPSAQERLAAVVRRAVDSGITHIETARGYGTSERQLGMLLPEFDRDALIVQTKVAPDADPARFAADVADSLDRLRLDRVELLSLHGLNSFEKLWWAVRPGGCLSVARQLQAEGRVGHVGFSTHGSPELVRSAIEHDRDGGFDYVNLHWYFINQTHDAALRAAAERDLGVFIISPADKGGRLYDPPDQLVQLCAPLHPLVFNVLFCLARPEIHTLSVGAARPSDFDLALSAVALIDRTEELVPPIEERLADAMSRAVGPGVYERLSEGVPDWEAAPGYANIRVVLWLRALTLGWGLTEFARGRYNLLGSGGDWFPGTTAAGVPEKAIARAVKDSPFADRIPAWLAEAHEFLAGASLQRLSQS